MRYEDLLSEPSGAQSHNHLLQEQTRNDFAKWVSFP